LPLPSSLGTVMAIQPAMPLVSRPAATASALLIPYCSQASRAVFLDSSASVLSCWALWRAWVRRSTAASIQLGCWPM